jgi:hypothetical protein
LRFLKAFGAYRVLYDENAYPRVYTGPAKGFFNETPDFVKPIPEFETVPESERAIYVSVDTALKRLPEQGKGGCDVLTLLLSSTKYRLSVTCTTPQVVVVNDYNDNNWVGYVNGVGTEVFRVNGNQIGILVGPGSQFVTLEYRPRAFFRSIYLSLFGVFLFILIVFYRPAVISNGAMSQ